MRRLLPLIPLLVALLVGATGCGSLIPSLPGMPGGGAASGGAPLWPDVPPLPGSTQVNVELPLPVKLMVKGFISAAQSSDESNTGEAKDWDFKVYQATGSGTDLGSFYSQNQMSNSGWTQGQDSCGASSPIAAAGGSLCLFTKPGTDGFTDSLVIVLMPGAGDGGNDQVAYVRFSSKS